MIGKCIYCPSAEQLSDEHAIPAGMRGSVILQFASCEACRRIIQPLEDHVLSIMLGPLRHAWGITAKPSPNAVLSINVRVAKGMDYKAKVPPSDLPKYSFAIPYHTVPPRILVPECDWIEDGVLLAAQVGKPDVELQMRKYGGTFTQQFHGQHFSRVLAKMAHCVLVAHLGLDGWDPTLLGLIRDGSDDDRWSRTFLGAAIPLQEVVALHEPNRCPVRAEIGLATSYDGAEYWAVNLHLLPDFGTPKHGLIVGKRLAY